MLKDKHAKKNWNTQDSAKYTLNLAVESLNYLANNLPAKLPNAVKLLLECRRLVITTGIGKSGFIAQKMAATLTSTGTPAIFLDPMNALHGDLGVVSSNDVVISYSYSGEAKEILALIPTLKLRKVPIISIIGKENSSLAQESDITLLTPIKHEACPLNLAPTTSTTVAMALSDSLAVALMTEKNYQAEDFALNHPAGSLGRRLTLRIKDYLPESENLLYCTKSALFSEVICNISASGSGAICITDESLHILGIITDGDIRRSVENHPAELLHQLTACDIMTTQPMTTTLNTLAIEALNIMEQRSSQISVLPVTDENQCYKGIIRLHDLIRAGL